LVPSIGSAEVVPSIGSAEVVASIGSAEVVASIGSAEVVPSIGSAEDCPAGCAFHAFRSTFGRCARMFRVRPDHRLAPNLRGHRRPGDDHAAGTNAGGTNAGGGRDVHVADETLRGGG
jgi:hypothetical protein